MTNKKILHIISTSILAVLLIIFFIPFDTAGRIGAAFVFSITAVAAYFLLKKRGILSINKQQVLLIVVIIAVVYLMLYYLTGLSFGFAHNPYALKPEFLLSRFLPAVIIIASTEIYRWVIVAQEDRTANVLCYISCVLAEMIVCSTAVYAISTFNHFMDLVAETMFPALIANLLYGYLSKRYGFLQNIIYRAVTTLSVYFIPIVPRISDALVAVFNLLLPLFIYVFIDSLYEKKIRLALAKKSKLSAPLTVLTVAIMVFVVMVISNHFTIGCYVIATDSMTGEINKGDAVIYIRYDDQPIEEGRVIAFEKNDIVIIHRVIDIQIINGQTRYFTKGDANEDMDDGYILDNSIVGIVTYKIPFIGYPSVWIRGLFSR